MKLLKWFKNTFFFLMLSKVGKNSLKSIFYFVSMSGLVSRLS